MSKYVKTTSSKCPVCGSDSPKTGNTCGHLYKLTSKGIYFWMNSIKPTRAELKIHYQTYSYELIFK